MIRRLLLPLAAAVAFATCDSGPKEGDLVFTLAAPHAQDGAVSFTITAADPETITGLAAECSGCQLFTHRVSETTMRGVVTGAVAPGPLVRVTVSNRKDSALYTATIQQVAARTYELRGLSGYTLTVTDD